jgi:hypothetical protein
MSWIFIRVLCSADVPQGECAGPVAVLSRQETMKDRDACTERVGEFIDFWMRPGRDGIAGQHFHIACKELPGA